MYNSILVGLPDVDFKIMLGLDNISLDKLCNTNKYASQICENVDFWKMKISKDFPFWRWHMDDKRLAKELYQQLYNFFDKYTKKIIPMFLNFKIKYDNMDPPEFIYDDVRTTMIKEAYNDVFRHLVKYVEAYLKFDYLSINLTQDEADLLFYTIIDNFSTNIIPILHKIMITYSYDYFARMDISEPIFLDINLHDMIVEYYDNFKQMKGY